MIMILRSDKENPNIEYNSDIYRYDEKKVNQTMILRE
jgi:hypothetical protein